MRRPLKYKWNSTLGLPSVWQVKLRRLLRSTVVLLGTEIIFLPVGASKKLKMKNKIKRLIQLILNYFYCFQSDTDKIPKNFVFSSCSGENSCFSYRFKGYARLLGKKKNSQRSIRNDRHCIN